MSAEADLLRRAAAATREFAAGTSVGRRYSADARTTKKHATWLAWPSGEYDEIEPEFAEEVARGAAGVQLSVPGGVDNITGRTPNWRDARWIAFVAPQVSEPLAAWLDSAAEDAAAIGPDFRALAVARVLLGETETKP